MALVLSSRLIEVLIGQRPDAQFAKLLASITFIYVMEPVMTFFYVKNVCAVGEEVVARLREDLFRALLAGGSSSSTESNREARGDSLVELGTVRTLVAANVSRDRGFRPIGECLGTLAVLWRIAPKLAPVLGSPLFPPPSPPPSIAKRGDSSPPAPRRRGRCPRRRPRRWAPCARSVLRGKRPSRS